MYKRPAGTKAFQYNAPKMRKLDVSVCGSSNETDSSKESKPAPLLRPSTSKVATNDKQNAPSSSAYTIHRPDAAPQPQTPNIPTSNNENMWADADDELILIASQVVDNMEVIGQQIIVQSMNLSQNNANEVKLKNGADDLLKDMLQSSEDEDRLFSELINFDNIGNINKHMNDYLKDHQVSPLQQRTPQVINQRQTSPSVFKVPSQIRQEKRTNATVGIAAGSQSEVNISFHPEGRPQSTQFSPRIEVPKPIEQIELHNQGQQMKVKFLTQKQGDLEKKIQHLEEENQRLTDQCQIKDGESSLLRSENERLKNLFDNTRREKSAEITKIKSDHAAKVSEMEKEILDLRSQLQFKEMSTKHQQFRKPNCSQMSQSIERVTTEMHPWDKFKLLNKSCFPSQDSKPVNPRIYISSNLCNSKWISIYDRKQWEYLNSLQVLLSDLMAKKNFSNNGQSKMLDEILNLASLSSTEMYASSMIAQINLKKNEFSYTHSEIGNLQELSIVSESRLFHHEEAFLSRRILVCLATICEQFPEFSLMLFSRNCVYHAQIKSILELLSLTLQNFCHYRNVVNLQGFIESSCLLLTTLAVSFHIFIPKNITTTANVLHNILLSRPGIRSLEKISNFLEIISYQCEASDFLDALCLRKNTHDIVEPLGLIRYTTTTCTLQIYALFIRLYILPHEKRNFSTKQLTAITQSTLSFMQNSLLKSPKWLVAEKRGNCLCRARLFGATVTLLYVYLLHWIENPTDIDSQTISSVAKSGVEFFYENLVKNYEHELLNAGGTIIKNRIRVIVEWLNVYDFEFKSAHQHALQSVCLQRLGPMVEYLRYNKNITSNFSGEASELYNDVKASFYDEYD